ncbi:hypothetical protein P1059_00951 [Pasteurella multocida subsp. gallicida P1059]|nr:hypothetical protein PMCN06_0895 [Pasteurella multocida subsp. multocida str. HN06]AFI45581.1 hypothetical protein NT08PM_0438 [Pasteurella multocida subsp. multocida str. 3480]AHE64294.1 hypothetical protein PMCN03_0839 [Pasteurella multocida subsp. multocida str. HB03]EJZ80507.1 hypothetical protein P1059_00951 [Pasteurella multocida subsp. gallicida P1059]
MFKYEENEWEDSNTCGLDVESIPSGKTEFCDLDHKVRSIF